MRYPSLQHQEWLGTISYQQQRVHRDMSQSSTHLHVPDEELDLRGVICPYNFVKTKLKLESMAPGQLLLVHLDDGDPIRNVPRSVSDDGHDVVSQERADESFRVMIRKRLDD